VGPVEALSPYWHPVAWAADLAGSPMATTLLGRRLVLWRGVDGQPVAAADRCPHRGTALSLGTVDVAGCLTCPYHGWTFEASGACSTVPQLGPGATIPARARLEPFVCQERHGLVWTCLTEPVADIPEFPEYLDPGYRHVRCAPYRWSTSPERMLENFTDFGHLGYLHDGLLGTRDDLVVPEHRVDNSGRALHYELTMSVPDPKARFAVADLAGALGRQTNRYRLTLPYAIHLACTYEDTGSHRTLFFVVQPHGDGSCTGYCYQSRDFDLDGDDRTYAAFQDLLAEQDRVIVESQQPAEIPEDLRRELHLPFDRVAVAYRRAMAALYRGNDLGDTDQSESDRRTAVGVARGSPTEVRP
jgi:vanillate O-demethylase monooxygenase subunit